MTHCEIEEKRARRENVTSGVELIAEARDNDDGFEKHLNQGNRDGEKKKKGGKSVKSLTNVFRLKCK